MDTCRRGGHFARRDDPLIVDETKIEVAGDAIVAGDGDRILIGSSVDLLCPNLFRQARQHLVRPTAQHRQSGAGLTQPLIERAQVGTEPRHASRNAPVRLEKRRIGDEDWPDAFGIPGRHLEHPIVGQPQVAAEPGDCATRGISHAAATVQDASRLMRRYEMDLVPMNRAVRHVRSRPCAL